MLLSSLSKLSQLRVLYLWDNDFTEGLPSLIEELTSLEVLNLHYCKLCFILSSLSKLSQQRKLNLNGNDFTEGLPSVIEELTSLEVLNLQYCNLQTLPNG